MARGIEARGIGEQQPYAQHCIQKMMQGKHELRLITPIE